MSFDKALDREASDRGRAFTDDELAERKRAIEALKVNISHKDMDRHDLLAAFVDLLDHHRSAISKLNSAFAHRGNSGDYALRVPDEQARRILAEVAEGKF